jgi:hypothetical protein
MVDILEVVVGLGSWTGQPHGIAAPSVHDGDHALGGDAPPRVLERRERGSRVLATSHVPALTIKILLTI